jgi:hypothetical protein
MIGESDFKDCVRLITKNYKLTPSQKLKDINFLCNKSEFIEFSTRYEIIIIIYSKSYNDLEKLNKIYEIIND